MNHFIKSLLPSTMEEGQGKADQVIVY